MFRDGRDMLLGSILATVNGRRSLSFSEWLCRVEMSIAAQNGVGFLSRSLCDNPETFSFSNIIRVITRNPRVDGTVELRYKHVIRAADSHSYSGYMLITTSVFR